MVLPVRRRYEIISLSQHSMGLKFGHAAVTKAVKYDMTQRRNIISKSGNSQRI